MDILNQLYLNILVQPIYNAVVAIYTTIAQQDAGTTLILIGILGAAFFMPTMIRNYLEQEQVKAYQAEISAIQTTTTNPTEQQQKVLTFLKSKNINFKSESIFLFGQAVVLILLYPVLTNHWYLDPNFVYSFTPQPEQLSNGFINILVNRSSPTFSLIPAILLFFELRQSYKEQKFLTSFVDKWYPVILPLFTYFLIFWLPSGLSLVLATALAVSLYIKYMLQVFTQMRRRQPTPRT